MEKKNEAETAIRSTEKSPTPSLLRLRLPDVCLTTGLVGSTIYRMESDRRFPRRIKIGACGGLDQDRD